MQCLCKYRNFIISRVIVIPRVFLMIYRFSSEKSKDSKSHKSKRIDNAKRNWQINRQNHTQKTEDGATLTPPNTGDELRCSARISCSYSQLVVPAILLLSNPSLARDINEFPCLRNDYQDRNMDRCFDCNNRRERYRSAIDISFKFASNFTFVPVLNSNLTV